MIWYYVLWITWACPGGWFSGLVPETLRPIACKAESRMEIFDGAGRGRAEKRIREQGQTAQMWSCRGLKCRQVDVRWITSVEFGGS